MREEIKLLCNVCFQPIDITEYPDGIYVNPCECSIGLSEEDQKELEENAYSEGQNVGYDMAQEDAYDRYRDDISELE